MYDTILIGAGYWAVGFSEANKGNNLIISDTVYLDDFSPCLRKAECTYTTSVGEALYREFENNHCIRNGMVDTVGGGCLLCQRAVSNDVSVLYQTFVSEKTEHSVTIHNDEGTSVLEAKRVIDLRPKSDHTYWNILVKGNNEDCFAHFDERFHVLHLPVENNFLDARRRFESYRLDHPELTCFMAATVLEQETEENSPFICYERGYAAGLGGVTDDI